MVETGSSPALIRPDAAVLQARTNLTSNLAALASTQPRLSRRSLSLPPQLTWLFARDGSLTGMLEGDRWWAGCSVPRRAADFMFQKMDIGGTVACFLSPHHSAQIRASLDKLQPQQAIIAIVPEEQTLAVLMHCEDFSADIAAHRLWIVAGEEWEADLERLFEKNPGFPTASQFIRPIVANPESADRLMTPAQRIFAEVSSRRTSRVYQVAAQWKRNSASPRRLCVVASSRFRLWDDAGIALSELSFEHQDVHVRRLDSDRPTSASPLALALAAEDCDAILAPNLARSNLAGVAPLELPWITWVTTPQIPSADLLAPHDRLLLADPAWQPLAEHAGWSGDRITVARWPGIAGARPNPAGIRHLSAIADTQPLSIPARVAEYSSQVLLWEMIQDELIDDPFSIGPDIESYLDTRRARFQIGDDGFDSSIFIERLVVPAYQQGIIRLLISHGSPVRLFGRGWDAVPDFAPYCNGPVISRSQLGQIANESAALVHVWPWSHAHPIDGMGKPVLRAVGKDRGRFIKEAQMAIRAGLQNPMLRPNEVLSSELVSRLLAALWA